MPGAAGAMPRIGTDQKDRSGRARVSVPEEPLEVALVVRPDESFGTKQLTARAQTTVGERWLIKTLLPRLAFALIRANVGCSMSQIST
jgi:hypothetical protein